LCKHLLKQQSRRVRRIDLPLFREWLLSLLSFVERIEAKSFHDLIARQPTLLRLLPSIGFDVQTGMDFLCLGGALLSFVAMVSRDQRNCVVFAVLWLFYLSLFQVGLLLLTTPQWWKPDQSVKTKTASATVPKLQMLRHVPFGLC